MWHRGCIDLTGTREFPSRASSMTGAIAHRGPDDEQFHLEPGVALGARRLSIIDLAGGRQPISNEDGSIWVAFNGELFEYPELRRGAAGRGHRLATRCDTEAWVHLYEDHRRGDVRKARGQFAVSLWDRNEPHADPGPRPRRDLSALLRRGRRLAALGLGDQGDSGLGPGARPARPAGHRPPLHVLLRGHDADVLRGRQVAPAGHFLKSGTAGSSGSSYWDLDFPDAGQERRLADPTPLVDELEALMRQCRRAAAAGRRAGGELYQRRARLDGRPRVSARASGATRSRRSRSASTGPARTSGARRPSRPRVWARRSRP